MRRWTEACEIWDALSPVSLSQSPAYGESAQVTATFFSGGWQTSAPRLCGRFRIGPPALLAGEALERRVMGRRRRREG